MKLFRLASLGAAAVLLYSGSAHAQFVDPASSGLQLQILIENVKQSLSMGQQLAQLQETVTTARENLALVRNVYAGVSEFTSYTPDDFLQAGRQAFLAANPELVDAFALGREFQDTVAGRPGAALSVNARVDVYGDASRRHVASAVGMGPAYDARTAWGLSREVQAVLDDAATRATLVRPAPLATASDGLLQADLARADAGLLEQHMRRQAAALSAEAAALAVYKESTFASPGKAQQLSAQSGAMTAAGIARLNETQGKLLTLEELRRQEEAAARAQERKESDAMWRNLGQGLEDSFRRSAPKPLPFGGRP